ncbi:hypothetical protein I545_0559 [Mycobacterium kansasii 662]|uniref:Uncharacterized protein n=2 Tax=Mycobacterium kansasii TaxID=1768 RepID=A0A1V3XRR8_MYCKA|nr:hypothetical protein I547_0798 [Mycobacterium kansasii 824]EUA20950.1 hypothetical protein I545_0559 [Mycobacterium kansasii 662]KEP43339.1 hypothetical protein MKSMC1_14840 [Mycobacterium kansasii]OOK81770.1 hypothetical protein BZL30_1297 [Mycobacterium kansasii]
MGIDKRNQSQTLGCDAVANPEIRAGYERKPHHGHYTHGGGNRTELSDQVRTRSVWLPGPPHAPATRPSS